ncbi:MAG: amino-acid N-acetyltransferase, partial [Pseudomonadales bacterium]|nr:amino-acid N-acetyltransferase [Pseudomonadales bacterium]
VHDIALLNSLGVRIVIVHGVRRQLETKLAAAGIQSQFVNNWRVSDRATLEAAIQACSLVRAELETKLSMGLPNSPMHGARVRVASGNMITARPAGIVEGIDLQHTGLVRKFDCDAINALLEMSNVVLLSPLGYSPAGEAFSLAYDHVASELAIALGADKLLVFCQPGEELMDQGALLRELSLQQAQQLLEQAGGQQAPAYLQAAVQAVSGGVPRAHLLDFALDGALLQELFTVDGAGTLISQRSFETIRAASTEDIPAIIELITPLENSGALVRRERTQLAEEIERFTVIEREGLLVALAALYPYTDDESKQAVAAEIACIATHPDYRNQARAAQLLQ